MTTITSNATTLNVVSTTGWASGIDRNFVRAVSHNTISNWDPCPSHTCLYSGSSYNELVSGWNSGMYAPDFGGIYGSLVHTGGGDGGYWGTEIYAFDLETLNWSRLDNPCTAFTPPAGSHRAGDDPLWVPDWGEHYQSPQTDGYVGRYPTCNTPGVPHTYDLLLAIPAGGAGGASGAVLYPTRAFCYGTGSSGRVHVYDLATKVWRRFSPNALATVIGQGISCVDTYNNCVWYAYTPPGQTIQRIDLTTGEQTQFNNSTYYPAYATALYYASRKVILYSGRADDFTWGLWYLNPDAITVPAVKLTVNGDIPTMVENANAPGFCCCAPDLDCFFVYDESAANAQKIWKITPPATGITGAWTSTLYQMQGDTVVGGPSPYTNGMFKRLSYASKVKRVMWYSSVGAPVYAYRPYDMMV